MSRHTRIMELSTLDIQEPDSFGCEYCGGMGYTDYPINNNSCPIEGHMERFRANERFIINAMREFHKNNPPPEWARCPYCKVTGKACVHWDGMGWVRRSLDV